MRRAALWIGALVVLNAALLLAGLGRGAPVVRKGLVRIGLVFDVGGLGDKSFNDAAYRGLRRAEEELDIETRYVEPGDGSERERAIRELAAAGYDLVIGVGFVFTDDVLRAARDFPRTSFACVDYGGA